jgi:hypothetical protein
VTDGQFNGVLVLTIALNEALNINRCLESVMSQNSQDWRQVVGDNSSSDETKSAVLSINDPRIRLLAWNSRKSSTENFIRTASEALASFPMARYIQVLNGDDYFKSQDILTIGTLPPTDNSVVVPVFENEFGEKIGPNFRSTALLDSRFRALRSIPLSKWVWSDIFHGRHQRQSFESLLSSLAASKRGTAEDDWRATTLYLLSSRRRIVSSEERIVRRSRNEEAWKQFHSQDNSYDPKTSRDENSDSHRIKWAMNELRQGPNTNSQFTFWISLVVFRILIVGVASKSKQIIIDTCKLLLDRLLSPLGLKIRRNVSSRKLELKRWPE